MFLRKSAATDRPDVYYVDIWVQVDLWQEHLYSRHYGI